MRMTAAASAARERSFHRIDAKPSGESTEYTACSCMATRSASAKRERAAAAAFAHEHAHRGHAKPRHGIQVVGDGIALAALLGLFAAERALRVHEAHHRHAQSARPGA